LPGHRTFRVNQNPGTSSLLEPRQNLISEYGIEKDYETDHIIDVACVTFPDILRKEGITTVDFLKTDLEGLDYEVLQSAEALLPNLIAIQCELRFQPFYHGEPYFHEVISYLNDRGFEVISLEPEYWQPVTQHRKQHIDGRITFCDVVLFKKEENLINIPATQRPLALAKQVILACMLGHKSYAEHILESHLAEFPKNWLNDLRALVKPRVLSFIRRSLMSLIRYGLRFTMRRFTHKHVVKGCKDEFFFGGSNR
jgi:hypothetical protein